MMADKDQEQFVRQQKAIAAAKAARILAQRQSASKESKDKK